MKNEETELTASINNSNLLPNIKNASVEERVPFQDEIL
jgi:hypothetical protein